MASSMRATAEISPGTLVGDRYCVQRTLGYGSCGCTYLVYDKQEPTQAYVLKEFAPADNREAVIQKCYSLFEQEAEVLCKLKHPQIPQCFDVFEDGGRLFLVQEYIDGKTFCELLQERASEDEVFSVEEVVKWLKDLLIVLDNIHSSRIIHRDISPDNIMLPNGGDIPVLIDFGVVKQVITQIGSQIGGETAASIRGTLVGKAGYSPPEQLRLGQCYPNSDLYSLAVTALVLLTGKHPNELCDGYSLKWQWRKFVRLNGSLARIFDKMLEEIPKDRYQSATEVLEALSTVSLHVDPLETSRPSYEETTAEFDSDADTDIWSEQNTSEQNTLLARSQPQKSVSALREIKTGKKTIVQEENGTSVQVGKNPSQPPASRRHLGKRRSRAASMGWLTVGVLISGSLIGGWALGSQSPKIAFVCNLLNNCANDDLPRSLAKGENETNVASEQPVWESKKQTPSQGSDRTGSEELNASSQPDEVAATNSVEQERSQTNREDLSEQIQREVENRVSQIESKSDRPQTSQSPENTNPPAKQQPVTPTTNQPEANQKPDTNEEKKTQSDRSQTLEIPEKSPLAGEPEQASSKPNQIKNPNQIATMANESKPKQPEAKPDNAAAPEVKPTPQNNGNVAVNTAEKPKTNSSTPRSAEKPQNSPSNPKKTEPSAQTYQPGYWQPVARINPKNPFKVKIVNQTKDVIEYAVTTNEFPPRQLYANENTTLTYIPLDANLLINSLAQTDKEFASSLEFEVSAANNVITVTIRPGDGSDAGDSTLNIDNKGAIYIF
jgi:serine/threonine protein kinase